MRLTSEDAVLLARWTLASVVGWGGGLACAMLLMLMGFAARLWFPVWALLPLIPAAGALAGGSVGWAQWAALGRRPSDLVWVRGSVAGGAVGGTAGAFLALLLRFDPLVAAFALGAGLAGGVALGQAFVAAPGTPDGRAAYRWALVNVAGGVLCAAVAPAGNGAWLPLTCLAGTVLFGLLTGAALLRVR